MQIEELIPSWVEPTLLFLNQSSVWYIYTLPLIICLTYFVFILFRQKQNFDSPSKDMLSIELFDTYWDVLIAVILSMIPILNWFMVIFILNSFLNKRV